MRLTSGYVENLWAAGGPFIGVDRANARVTVEKNWYLSTTTNVAVSDTTKLPFRWWQRYDNSQVETEIPNVRSISWDRSIDSDAASCNIVLHNQKMDPNLSGQNIRLGTRGYYSWKQRGINARARWPENVGNEWTEVLVPNALIRTYEGFGGHGKTLTQALLDGNLFLSGVWLIDDVRVGSDGQLQLQCRDMSKLLLEQQLYVPLMPRAKYPLNYYKWRYETTTYPAVPFYDRTNPVAQGPGAEGPKWVPDIGIDRDGSGYSIVGTDGGVFSYETQFYGSRGMGAIEGIVAIAKRPTGDGYWVTDRNGGVYARGAAVFYGSPAAIVDPIVNMAATHTGSGYWLLDGIGDVYSFGDAMYHGGTPENTAPMVGMAGTSTGIGGGGYWMVSETGAVYSFGNAVYGGNAAIAGGQKAAGIAGKGTDGYWIVATDGAVYAKGSAAYHGGANGTLLNAPIAGIAATPSGNGYWLLGQDGGVFAYGDATFYGTPIEASASRGIAAMANGYWIVADNGHVSPLGTVTDYGSPVSGVDPTPMRGIAMDPLGRGYWLTAEDGSVYAFGEVGFYGRVVNPSAIIVRIVATPSGRGYWQLGEDGGVFAFGDAPFQGSGVGVVPGGEKVVDMARTSTGLGYWLLTEVGSVYSFGDAIYHGNAPVTAPDKAVGIAARAGDDGGYWIVSANGGIFALGSAPFYTAHGDWESAKANLSDPITSVESSVTGNGYVLVGGDGGVFSFGDATFWGSLPGPFMLTRQFPGNYDDLSDIVKDLLLWSGWCLFGAAQPGDPNSFSWPVFGNIERTGTYVESDLPADTFDKKPVIDAINAVRDIVGFLFWIDEEGGARFETPNWYTYGNFLQETGLRIGGVPEIDERVQLTSYSVTYSDRSIRSEIIITSDDPLADNTSTVTTIRPISTNLLRGMVRPAMIATPFNVTKTDQEIMAQLIEQHIHYQSQQGSVTCVANPALQVNDQVRIYEQVSGETDVHFIRGVSSNHDLDTGVWTYTLTTNRLGPGRTTANSGQISAVPEPVS